MTSNMPPGWYYADGDPPGTQRYWDGATWTGGPQPVAGAPGTGVPATMYPEPSQAVVALVLSIVSFVVCCLIPSPIAWYIGDKEMKAIAAGRRDPSQQNLANAGKIIGMIGTILLGLGIGLWVVLAIIGAATG